jgi:putative ABC transport system permease protein
MTPIKAWLSRLRAVREKDQWDQTLNEEVEFHLEMQTQENIRRGMSPSEARFAALRQFGGVEQRKEDWRDLRFFPRLETWLQDAQYALRALTRARGYAIFAVLSLALGIGASTAIFTLVRSLVLRPLPYPQPEQLVRLFESSIWMGSSTWGSVSVPNLKDWRDQSSTFAALGAYSVGGVNLTEGGDTLRLPAASVESSVFEVMGVRPLLGRVIAPEENTPGRDRVAVLGHSLWVRQFGGNAGVVGSQVELDGAVSTVIGVMPEGFRFPPRSPIEVWTPLLTDQDWMIERGNHWLNVIGRLKPGVDLTAARQELNEVARRLRDLHKENATRGVLLEPLHFNTVRGTARLLVVLGFAVACVFLLACANVAHLVLARAAGRRRELAVRAALGASRWRLVRLFLIEGILLAGFGALAGMLAAQWSMSGLLTLAGEQLPTDIPVEWDRTTLVFGVFAAMASAILAALLPAFRATKTDLHSGLKEAGAATGVALGRSRNPLMVWEVALALMLVVGALALFRSLQVLNLADLGFAPENVLTMKVAAPETRYADPGQLTAFTLRAMDRIQMIPGVRHAGMVNLLPIQEAHTNGNFSIRGRAKQPPGHEPAAEHRVVTPGYFEAMGIPLVAGRAFNAADQDGPNRVAVINERAARIYWPGQNPLGQWIAWGTEPKPESWMQIVGIAGNVRHVSPFRPPLTAIYMPVKPGGPEFAWPAMSLVVRSPLTPDSLARAIREEVRSLDPGTALYLVKTMSGVVSDSTAGTRFLARLLSLFSMLAVVLALVGVYGVMSYLVSQRTHEIGVRIAFGAGSAGILHLVLARALRTALIGAAVGTMGSVTLLVIARHYLLGVDLGYLWTYGVAAAGIVTVALAASMAPAWRASRVDPLDALRDE